MIGEWSGLRFLQSIEGARWFGPTPLAADPALGLVLIEDLGEGDALADLLQRSGVGVAEDATAALFAYAESLGFMHAATHGRRGAYEATRSACGATAPRGWDDASKLHTEILSSLRASAAEIGLPFPAGAENEIVEVAQVLASPGPFDALSVSDTCPDNHRYFPHPAGSRRSSSGGDGGSSTSGGHLRFFDFEFSSFRHALIDAAYVWMPFPTCWCVNRLPDGLPERLEAAYRRALVSGCPEAAEDTPFTRGLAAACVYWLADSFASDVMGLHRTLDEDRQWGISTTRQRHPLRADNTAAVCERYGWFPTIAELARRFAAHLRERWGEAADMPLYPAFRHPSH